ncbi:MAG: type IV toxin-antitoxin system AbiEi family antitoxin domain-containing protein [Thermoproteota archaeon]
MGRIIYIDKLREFFKTTPVFRAGDVEVLTGSREYTHLILHKLSERGEVKRIVKGWYSLREDPLVAVFCFKPAYIGLQEALSLHDLWEQETNVIIVSTRRVRTGVRKIFDSNVVIHRISEEYFFGFEYLNYGEFFIPVSDVEKTLIDLVYFNEVPSEEVLNEIRTRIDRRRLNAYLRSFKPKLRQRVLKLI